MKFMLLLLFNAKVQRLKALIRILKNFNAKIFMKFMLLLLFSTKVQRLKTLIRILKNFNAKFS